MTLIRFNALVEAVIQEYGTGKRIKEILWRRYIVTIRNAIARY